MDTCCFHAQQAAEKLLKAYLVENDLDFPFTHNLPRLIGLAAARDPAFRELSHVAETLTPYAVQLRVDDEFWPAEETAAEACDLARCAETSVLHRLSTDLGAPPAMDDPGG